MPKLSVTVKSCPACDNSGSERYRVKKSENWNSNSLRQIENVFEVLKICN